MGRKLLTWRRLPHLTMRSWSRSRPPELSEDAGSALARFWQDDRVGVQAQNQAIGVAPGIAGQPQARPAPDLTIRSGTGHSAHATGPRPGGCGEGTRRVSRGSPRAG